MAQLQREVVAISFYQEIALAESLDSRATRLLCSGEGSRTPFRPHLWTWPIHFGGRPAFLRIALCIPPIFIHWILGQPRPPDRARTLANTRVSDYMPWVLPWGCWEIDFPEVFPI